MAYYLLSLTLVFPPYFLPFTLGVFYFFFTFDSCISPLSFGPLPSHPFTSSSSSSSSHCPLLLPGAGVSAPHLSSLLAEALTGMQKLCSSLCSNSVGSRNSDSRPTSPFRHHFLPHSQGKGPKSHVSDAQFWSNTSFPFSQMTASHQCVIYHPDSSPYPVRTTPVVCLKKSTALQKYSFIQTIFWFCPITTTKLNVFN